VVRAPTLCLNQKLESLAFKHFFRPETAVAQNPNMLPPKTALAQVTTLFLQQKRPWLLLQRPVSTRNCSGSCSNTFSYQKLQWLTFKQLFRPETAVAHAPTVCFNQKLQWLMSHHFFFNRNGSGFCYNSLFQPETAVASSARNYSGSYSKVVFQCISGFHI
jgi:hypothetical protein